MTTIPEKFTIKDWDESDRPREKLCRLGASNLSNADLFAILIGSGSLNDSAIGLMQRILNSVENDLIKLHQLPLEHLLKFNGIGMAKAVKVKAAPELSKRMNQRNEQKTLVLNHSKVVYECLQYELAELEHEEFWVLYLNQSSKLLEKHRLSQGGITQTSVDIRLALKRAFEVGATALILAHNHPSGNLKPSQSDKDITHKFPAAAKLVDLSVLDHLIISEKGYFSFADEDLM
jgi:DNA repair protein RadC